MKTGYKDFALHVVTTRISADYRLSRVTLNRIEHVSSKTLIRFVNILYMSCLFDDMFFRHDTNRAYLCNKKVTCTTNFKQDRPYVHMV